MKLKYREFNLKKYESHWLVINEIKPNSKVLDIGCATGYIAKKLNNEKNCRVWGIEIDKDAAKIAKPNLEKVFIGDVKESAKFNIKQNFFDCILLQDVIEHIVDIKPVLEALKAYLTKNGKIIISTPNIAHLSPRMLLFFGEFEYTETGIMDRTHVHFYTKKSLITLLEELEYKVEKIEYSSDFGQIPLLGRFLRYVPKKIQHTITNIFPTILAVQFIVVCY